MSKLKKLVKLILLWINILCLVCITLSMTTSYGVDMVGAYFTQGFIIASFLCIMMFVVCVSMSISDEEGIHNIAKNAKLDCKNNERKFQMFNLSEEESDVNEKTPICPYCSGKKTSTHKRKTEYGRQYYCSACGKYFNEKKVKEWSN